MQVLSQLPLWRLRRWCRQRVTGGEVGESHSCVQEPARSRRSRTVGSFLQGNSEKSRSRVSRTSTPCATHRASVGRDSGVVYDASDNVRPLHESLQGLGEIPRFADHPVGWRCVPGMELQPGLLRRCGPVFPDAAIGHHAQELVAARPGNRPGPVSLGKIRQEGVRCLAELGLTAVRVDKDIGVDCDHRVPGSP